MLYVLRSLWSGGFFGLQCGRCLAVQGCGRFAQVPISHHPGAPAAVTPEQAASWVFVGGVPEAAWRAAPALPRVQAQVAALIQGRVLVGHNLPQVGNWKIMLGSTM